MDAKRAGSVLLIFLAVLVIGWATLYWGTKDANAPSAPESEGAPAAASVILTHILDGNVHTYDGEIETPTPCHELAASVAVSYGKPPVGRIDLTTAARKDVICAQVIVKQPFSVSFMSDEVPEVRLTVNGEPRSVAIVEGR